MLPTNHLQKIEAEALFKMNIYKPLRRDVPGDHRPPCIAALKNSRLAFQRREARTLNSDTHPSDNSCEHR